MSNSIDTQVLVILQMFKLVISTTAKSDNSSRYSCDTSLPCQLWDDSSYITSEGTEFKGAQRVTALSFILLAAVRTGKSTKSQRQSGGFFEAHTESGICGACRLMTQLWCEMGGLQEFLLDLVPGDVVEISGKLFSC